MADILEIEDGVLKKMYGQRCCERGDTRGRHGNRQCGVHVTASRLGW